MTYQLCLLQVFPQGSPMVPDFTKALLNVSESGILRDLEKRMLGSEHCVDQETIQDQYGSLGLGSFLSLFLLAGGISTITLVIYIMQNLCQLERRSLITIITEEALSTPIGAAADSYECPTTGWVTNEKNEDELGIASFIDDDEDFTDSTYPNLAMQWK
ncbi:hypothetical protein L1987_49526 [Smallanthus sonchifolius]|uniref:Uncharacterized protein n=1 Tax=Smallanthus sonchifolius TaxID=185202 RepID=A0ACB9FUZ8_9ASTR|nr:hypothetical protein L1987_49526 [Smallanthus sonchifolius]